MVREFRASFNGNYADSLGEGATEEDRDYVEAKMTNLFGGVLDNKLRRINPIYAARYDYVEKAKAYFRAKSAAANSDQQQ